MEASRADKSGLLKRPEGPASAGAARPNQIGTQSRTKKRGSAKKKRSRYATKSRVDVESRVAKKRNLAKKIEDRGNPIVMKFMTKVAYHSRGVLCHSPQTCQKSRVP